MHVTDADLMRRAIELARRGEGWVEPNPMVGCVIVRDGQVVGEGWHQKFGGPHAEIHALEQAGPAARGATMYVTLEPCCHHGKTPPCSAAVVAAGIRRVVVALADPFPQVGGGGIAQLSGAGVEVEVGLRAGEARDVLAPYLKLVEQRRPWVIAKWAMTLDGKIATSTGDSQWISGEASRAVVHRLRGRVDAIIVGRRTAQLDDPQLTARPAGPRLATRVVVDSTASLALDSRLVQTAHDAPVLLAVSSAASEVRCAALAKANVEVFRCPGESHDQRLTALLDELGRRGMTNVLVEGGGMLLGSLHDQHQIDEVHVFVAPKIIGGSEAASPLAGAGVARIAEATRFALVHRAPCGDDLYFVGRRRQ